jgi:hypothetical protein
MLAKIRSNQALKITQSRNFCPFFKTVGVKKVLHKVIYLSLKPDRCKPVNIFSPPSGPENIFMGLATVDALLNHCNRDYWILQRQGTEPTFPNK